MRGTVSPKLEPFLLQVNEAIATAKAQGIGYTPQATRDGLNNLAGLMADGPEIANVSDVYLPNYETQVRVRIYNPAPDKALPVLLHFHGGGHMCGSIELYDPISRELATHCQAIVMCIDYRLAPEYPYPQGLNDCQYLLENFAQLLKGHQFTDDLYIAGDSAGGAICTSLVANNLDNEAIEIDKQILIYPSVDYTMSFPSCQENGEGFLLEMAKVEWYFEQYFSDSSPSESLLKSASPLHHSFSNNMPDTLLITAGCDPLRDEGAVYATLMKGAGAKCKHIQFDDMIHAYMLVNDLVVEEYEETLDLIADFIEK